MKPLLWSVLALSLACGSTSRDGANSSASGAKSTTDGSPSTSVAGGVGGAATGGTGTGDDATLDTTASTNDSSAGDATTSTSGSMGGNTVGGSSISASSGGASSGGASSGGASSGNSGAGGGIGGSPRNCDAPYTGPAGGPRLDGPENLLTPCDMIADEVILDRYKDGAQKVPQGLYFEPVVNAVWEQPCSESLDDTEDRASSRIEDAETRVTSDWSHEVSGCFQGNDLRMVYSNLRCDYFDGTQLSTSAASDLAYFASLIWWIDNGNVGGFQILGHSVTIGGASDAVHLCTIRTTFGDFGLCDEVTLERTTHVISADGQVTLGEPTELRTIQGDCN